MKNGFQAASTVAVVLLGTSAAPAQVAGQRDWRAVPVADAWVAGWLGVSVDMQVEQRGRARTTSVVVARVIEGGPAAEAGLEAGDVIVRVNGRSASPSSFEKAARILRPGDTLRVTVQRPSGGGIWRADLSIEAGTPPDSPVTRLPAETVARVQSFIDRLDSLEWRIEAVRTPGEESARFRIRGTDGDMTSDVQVGFRGDSSGTFLGLPDGELALVREGGPGPATLSVDSMRGPAFILRAHFPDTIAERIREAAELDEPLVPSLRGLLDSGDGDAARRAPPLEESPRSVLRYLERRDLVAGARLTRLVPDLADYFGVGEGLLVLEVIRWTPAAEAGLLPGDVLVEVDGRALDGVAALRLAWNRGAEEGLVLSVVRRGERMELRLPG